MPRLAIMPDELCEKWIRAIIEERCAFYGYGKPELAKRAGINYDTLNRRMKSPLKFTLAEIMELHNVLNFDKEKLITILLR